MWLSPQSEQDRAQEVSASWGMKGRGEGRGWEGENARQEAQVGHPPLAVTLQVSLHRLTSGGGVGIDV